MSYNSEKAIFFYLRLVLVLGINSILPKGWGIIREKSIVSIADKDNYIYTAYAMSDYGVFYNSITGFSIFGDTK